MRNSPVKNSTTKKVKEISGSATECNKYYVYRKDPHKSTVQTVRMTNINKLIHKIKKKELDLLILNVCCMFWKLVSSNCV